MCLKWHKNSEDLFELWGKIIFLWSVPIVGKHFFAGLCQLLTNWQIVDTFNNLTVVSRHSVMNTSLEKIICKEAFEIKRLVTIQNPLVLYMNAYNTQSEPKKNACARQQPRCIEVYMKHTSIQKECGKLKY